MRNEEKVTYFESHMSHLRIHPGRNTHPLHIHLHSGKARGILSNINIHHFEYMNTNQINDY